MNDSRLQLSGGETMPPGGETMTRYYLLSTAIALLVCALASPAQAARITLNEDTVIDAANTFPEPPAPDGLQVNIVDGAGGPTTVEVREGGVIGGAVNVYDSSRLNMTGGGIEALVTLFDNSTFTLSGGTILPLIRDYDAVDVAGVLRVTEQATLNLRGGSFLGSDGLSSGAILQQDSSVISIYCHSFVTQGEFPQATTIPRGVRVQGIYSDGSPFKIEIDRRSFDALVILHTIPEPMTAAQLLVIITISLAGQRPPRSL